jgi:Na+-driven multidrug efflux pump
MYGQLVSKYLILLPITYLGTVTPLGVVAVYVALIAEMWSVALVVGHRFISGKWKAVSRTYRPSPTDD